jgi:K+-sensing histidine kinase KdpD
MVSRNHLKVEPIDGKWWVEDLASSHGTFLDDEPLKRMVWEPGVSLRLADGAYYLTLKHETPFSSEINLQAILQTAHVLTGEVELDELLERTLDRLLSISGTDRGFLMLPKNNELVVKVQRNLGADMEKDIHLSMSSVRKVFEQGEPVWIHNVAEDEHLMAQQSILDLQLKTILCLPLLVQGKCIGVVYLDSRRIVTEPVDRATFEAIVSLCAIAIERTRLAEENLRNEVLATVGQAESTIVHDFKNALFVVAGHAQMLGASSSDSVLQHHVNQILGAVDRLTQMSSDVLDYAKVREPNRETVELGTFLSGLVEPLKSRAADIDVVIRCDGPTCRTSLDRNRFARVIENLLANALDAMAGRTDGEVRVYWRRESGNLVIEVSDNGKGIPKKVVKRIFEPFFSYGKTRGTGIGMATVKRIVNEHGGEIEVTSEEGVGTTICMTILEQTPQRGCDDETTDSFRPMDLLNS